MHWNLCGWQKSEKFLKHEITFVLSSQYLNSNGANFESALEVKNETEINLKKNCIWCGTKWRKKNHHKNEKCETNDTLRIKKVFHWKWVWSDLILSNVLDGQPKFIKTRPQIQISTFCSGMFLIFVWCYFSSFVANTLILYFTFSSDFVHFFAFHRVFIVFVHFLLAAFFFVQSTFFWLESSASFFPNRLTCLPRFSFSAAGQGSEWRKKCMDEKNERFQPL